MGKLRNARTDIGKFTQWIGRKCRNHNPLEELQISSSRVKVNGAFLQTAAMRAGDAKKRTQHTLNSYKASKPGELFMLGEDESVLLYQVGERIFEVKVREVDADTHAGMTRIAIGY